MRKTTVGLLLVAMALALGACKIGPNFKVPFAPRADAWREVQQGPFIGQPVDKTEWWKTFNDPVLNSLVEQAFQQNLTLQQASLRVVDARVRRAGVTWTWLPLITGKGSAMHLNMSETVKPDVDVTLPDVSVNIPPKLGGILGRLPPVLQVSGKPDVKMTPSLDVYSAGFDALWEVELWGKRRRLTEAAKAELDAAYAGYDDVMISLAGEVAATYIQIRTLEHQLKVTRENVALQKKFEKITQEGFKEKRNPETDVVLAAAFRGATELAIPEMENRLQQAENALCVLLGKAPYDLRGELGAGAPIPVAPARIAAGLPADLLRRRPDVRLAERLAHAQCARIGFRKANILPSLSLIGGIGLKSTDSNRFFRSDSVTGSYGGLVNVTNLILYPVTIEMVRSEDARFEAALLQYQETVINAQREVENAMTGFLKAQDQAKIAGEAAKACGRAAELAVGAYQQGKVIVSVPLVALGLQTSLQNQAFSAEGTAAANIVAMYKAMGGGWQVREGRELVPEGIRERMKERTDWWTFAGKYDLRTARTETVMEDR